MSKKGMLVLPVLILGAVLGKAYADVIDGGGELTVTVTNIKSNLGMIRIGLFDDNKSYRRSGNDFTGAFKRGSIKINASNGTAVATFKNIPYGTYGVKVFQDEDNSKELKTDWFGKTKEDVGYSNNVDGSAGVPDFEPVQFVFDEKHTTQIIKMQRATAK